MKKTLVICLIISLSLCVFSCKKEDNNIIKEPIEVLDTSYSLNIGDFEEDLINYISDINQTENYIFSPLSFKIAIELLLPASDDNARDEIVRLLNKDSIEEIYADSEAFNSFVSYFNYDRDKENSNSLLVSNSVWKNLDLEGEFKKSYVDEVEEHFNAEVFSEKLKNLREKINSWTNKKTKGLIPSIIPDSYNLDSVQAILVNSIYFKDCWVESFEEYNTEEKDFNCIDGTKVKKDFMSKTDYFNYYEDEDTKILILPFKKNVEMLFILGNTNDISNKMKRAEKKNVKVEIPKFEIESSFLDSELVNFMKERDVKYTFDENYNAFPNMISDRGIYVSDILQKAKIKLDEEGVEAAAVTTIMTKESGIFNIDEEIKEFICNEPFSFYIYETTNDITEVLFNGKLVK